MPKVKNNRSVKGKVRVSNVVGSSTDTGSKKEYWEQKSGKKFGSCQISACEKEASVGAHLWVKGKTSNKVAYIAPICQTHNKKSSGDYPNTMMTKETAKLIPRATTHVSFKGKGKGKGQRKTN